MKIINLKVLFFLSSLRRHYQAIDFLAEKEGLIFWDYGNAFLLEVSRSGGGLDISAQQSQADSSIGQSNRFKYPSYMQDVMGDIFSLGFGPFRYNLLTKMSLCFKYCLNHVRKLS